MATSKKKVAAPRYKLSIRVGDAELKGEGANAYEALASVKRPQKITGKTFVKISDGKRNAERMFMPLAAKRLFYPLAQRILAKQLEYLLK